MAIVASFTTSVSSGQLPLEVTFTDTSSGSPTSWFWDFGDGNSSTLQNPTHTYNTSGVFSVTLTAYISTGTTDIAPTQSNSLTKQSDFSGTAAFAFENFTDNQSFAPGEFFVSGGTGVFTLLKNGAGLFQYSANKVDLSFDLTSHGSKQFAELIMNFGTNPPHNDGGAITFDGTNLTAVKGTSISMKNVTSSLGGTLASTLTDKNDFATALGTEPSTNQQTGYVLKDASPPWKVTAHTASEIDTASTNITVQASEGFTVSTPRFGAGTNTEKLNVTFDENVPNNPTAFSWKRRPSGIQAPYVEFSTDANPTETFDVTDPTP